MSEKIIYIDKNNKLNLSKLRPAQREFIKSTKLNTGIKGGYQSGKSLSGAIKVITKLLQDPGVPIAYYLPTYALFDDMLIPKFTKLFNDLDITFKHHKQDSKIITPYGEIWMRSMDTPDRIVSYSVGYSLVDEVDVVHPNKREDAIKRISGRNSYKKSTKNCIDFVSTPEGFNYMYNYFIKKANDNKLLLTLDTLDNRANLGDGYIDGLREMYDKKLLKAYLHGEFVNLTLGSVYYKFNREQNHSNETIKDYDTLYCGMDFNIGNMSALIHIKRNLKPVAVDEITGVYDTSSMINALKDKYPKKTITIYPDSSGKNRATNADKTDIQLLKDAGFRLKYKSTNPPVMDRIKNMNRMFCNGKNEVNYMVNTKMCPEYTEALERMGNDKHGQPDKTSGFDHITESGGYFIYYEYPLRTRRPPIN